MYIASLTGPEMASRVPRDRGAGEREHKNDGSPRQRLARRGEIKNDADPERDRQPGNEPPRGDLGDRPMIGAVAKLAGELGDAPRLSPSRSGRGRPSPRSRPCPRPAPLRHAASPLSADQAERTPRACPSGPRRQVFPPPGHATRDRRRPVWRQRACCAESGQPIVTLPWMIIEYLSSSFLTT